MPIIPLKSDKRKERKLRQETSQKLEKRIVVALSLNTINPTNKNIVSYFLK